MILVRNRLILDFIFNVIKWIIKIVYKIITLINMQLPLLVILVGLVLFLCGVFDGGGLALAIFGICLVVSIIIGLIGLIKKIFGSDDKKETTTTTTQIVETPPTVVYVNNGQPQVQTPPIVDATGQEQQTQVQAQPQYYRVKQNPNYVMAEYPDRYELYKLSGGNMIRVRTDYK